MSRRISKIICVECFERAALASRVARLLGWRLWVGGARCPSCSARSAQRRQSLSS